MNVFAPLIKCVTCFIIVVDIPPEELLCRIEIEQVDNVLWTRKNVALVDSARSSLFTTLTEGHGTITTIDCSI